MSILDDLTQDVRYALRQLRRSPLFALTATVSLAVGIGANAAVFTLVDRLLLRPLPVANPDRLVIVTDQRSRVERSPRFSYPFYTALARRFDRSAGSDRGPGDGRGALLGLAAHFGMPLNATIDADGMRVNGELVSGAYFTVLGAGTQRGRPLTADDDRTPGAHPVAVISDTFWRRAFAADPAIVGRTIRLNSQAFTIIGVAARGFTGTDVGQPADVWLPLTMQREVGRNLLTVTSTNWLEIFGRLAPGASFERASAELATSDASPSGSPDARVNAAVGAKAAAGADAGAGAGADTRPGAGAVAGADARRGAEARVSAGLFVAPLSTGGSRTQLQLAAALRVLFALTGLALLMACINVASLLVVRSSTRAKEMAVRLALGARRSRLVWQSVTETLLVSLIGGAAGLLVAPWVASILVAGYPVKLGVDTTLDARVLLFGVIASVLTGLVVGLAPVLASRKVEFTSLAASSLRTSSATSRGSASMHQAIVASQIALSLVLLIGAGLFVQSLRGLSRIDPGFEMDNLLVMSIDPRGGGYDEPRIKAFWREALARVRQVPGVEHASLAKIVPLGFGRERRPLADPSMGGRNVEIDVNAIGSDYFRTLGVPLRSGREFTDRDDRTSRPVIIVNERLASMFWPGQDPLGKGLRIDRPGSPEAEIIGVVSDVKYRDLREAAAPMFYMPIQQSRTTDAMTLHVRTSDDPAARAFLVRGALRELDGNLPLFEMTTLADRIYASTAETRQAAVVSGGFGLLALLLSALGVYGVTALAISRQTHDIGIRMALGAERRHIVRVIGRRGLTFIAAGLACGLVGAAMFTKLAVTLLYGISARDPATFASMAMLLGVVSVVAIAIPLRAATRLDMVTAIRAE